MHSEDCGCKHDHAHCHTHDHAHTHAHKDLAEEVVENALIFSRKSDRILEKPMIAGDFAAQIGAILQEIARSLAVDGAVLGHIKALLQCEEAYAAFSVTRTDALDMQYSAQWDAAQPIAQCTLTVNILSLANTDAAISRWVEALFASH